MKLIETIEGKKYVVKIYFEMVKDTAKYTVIPCRKKEVAGFEYPVSAKIKLFTSREGADHYAAQL